MFIIRYLKSFYLSGTMALIIIFLSLIPINTTNDTGLFDIPHLDKIAHFIFYFILSFFLFFEITKHNSGKIPFILIPIIICFVYGGIIEIIQTTQEARSGEILDLIADLAGSIAAIPVYLFLNRILNRKKV